MSVACVGAAVANRSINLSEVASEAEFLRKARKYSSAVCARAVRRWRSAQEAGRNKCGIRCRRS